MNYMTPEEAAEKWHVSLRRVQYLCNNNRIPGVQHFNRRWLIPINSAYPKRPPKSKNSKKTADNYRFPFFLFSDFCVSNRDLNESEKKLLSAQILMVQRRRVECLALCQEIENSTAEDYIKFGAYYTIVQSSLPMGLYSQTVKYMDKMVEICENNPVYKSDYKLLIATCTFQYTYDDSPLKDINIDTLSHDALITYKCILLQTSILYSSAESPTALKIYDSLCKELEDNGIFAAAFIAYSIVGLFYGRAGDDQAQKNHIRKACQIGCEHEYYSLVTKYSSLNPTDFGTYLNECSKDFLKRIEKYRTQDQLGWRVIYNAVRGEKTFPDCTADEADLLMLLSYNLTNEKIGAIKNTSNKEVNEIIKELCEKHGFRRKAELVSYAKNIFSAKSR